MPLRADNGKVLEVREPIVLDAEDNPIFVPGESNYSHQDGFDRGTGVKVFRIGAWLLPLAILGIAAVLFLGTLFAGVFLVSTIIVFIIRFLFKLIGIKS